MRLLSIETNLKSPFSSGSHLLRLLVEDIRVGRSARPSVLSIPNASFCDPFSPADPRICDPSTNRSPSLPFNGPRGKAPRARQQLTSSTGIPHTLHPTAKPQEH
jgi:hypothetical protein